MKTCWVVAFALVAAVCPAQLTESTILDRTAEPLPLTDPGPMPGVTIVDKNTSRPAVVLHGTSFKCSKIVRATDGDVYRQHPPRPASMIEYSSNDYGEAAVVLFGTGTVDVPTIEANVGVLVLPGEDGSYGFRSVVKVSNLKGYVFGVLASGQRDLTVKIGTATAYLWPDPQNNKNSHAFYANETRCGPQYMRLLGADVTILHSRGKAMGGATRALHPTAKFKGSWGVRYTCLDDQNPGGALDSFQSSGTAVVTWKHPGGVFQNPQFLGARLGDGQPMFGNPPCDFVLSGSFDGSKAPDQSVNTLNVHVLGGMIGSTSLKVTGKVDCYGAAQPLFKWQAVGVVSD